MITNHFKSLQRSLLLWGGNSNLYGTYHYLNIQGQDRYQSGYTYTPQPWAVASSVTAAGIHLGSGTTAPTADDYCLEEDRTVDVTAQVTSVIRTKNAGGDWSQAVAITVTNTTGEPVTIAEVGYYGSVRGATSEESTSSSNTNMVVMFDRTLLDTPIAIPVGDAATITYTVSVS